MKVSARNVIDGTIKEIKKGATTSHVLLDVGGKIITASITNEAVDELKLAAGQKGARCDQGFGRYDSGRLSRPACEA
jgi:molybdopterin-binding protein